MRTFCPAAGTLSAERWPWADLAQGPLPPTPRAPDEKFWQEVRARFLVPKDVGFFNAANLCPMSLPVVEAIERNIRAYEVNPSPDVRATLLAAREDARKLIATALRVTPEEIVLTRNTTEGNNFVSSGLTLGPGDQGVLQRLVDRVQRPIHGLLVDQPVQSPTISSSHRGPPGPSC